jgi:uracil-DNA glycosylase
MSLPLYESWYTHLKEEFADERMQQIKSAILADKEKGISVYPLGSLIFNAFNLTPLDQVKVVILGQDPYHGVGQAHGLSFSVPDGVAFPPSLQNIFKEIGEEFGSPLPITGNLTRWAQQGVFLLNSILTVQASQPLSHQAIGWQWFTDRVIKVISDHTKHTVFLLW